VCSYWAVNVFYVNYFAGAPGPADDGQTEKWDEVDDIVFAILGRDSAVVTGLDVVESGGNQEDRLNSADEAEKTPRKASIYLLC
jgi:hypothetical protein